MPSRELDFPVFDADNHLYETTEALTKFLPVAYEGVIDYIDVKGRTKVVVKGHISDYIPNPTFERVAAPGVQEDYFKHGNPEGKSRRELMGKAIDALPAYRDPGPRIELMDELGIDRALMWPTLASLTEERLRDDPEATHAVVHAFNQWLHEHWTFNYEERIFTTPIISLPLLDEAIKELAWVVERGAKVILVRPAPVPTYRGPRSFALPEFDPFWEAVQESGVVVGMHASDSGYQRYLNEWEGVRDDELTPFKAGSGFAAIITLSRRAIVDSLASAVGHGLCTRFPDLRITPIEQGSGWVRPLLRDMERAYLLAPQIFEENPVEVFKRCVFVHPFLEDDPIGLIEAVGVDNVLFGSDYPHPEGMVDPLSFVDDLEGLPADQIAKVMGGNLARLMHIAS